MELTGHQNDIEDVAGIDTSRELLRRGQDGFLVVLEVAKMLLAERAVVRGVFRPALVSSGQH